MAKIDRIKSKKARERKALREKQALAELREEETGVEEELIKDQSPETAPDEPETLEKYYDSYGVPMPAPTSFAELDAMEEAREKAYQVREVTWNVQDLVNNILWDPTSDPKEKSTKIQNVASEFESRVSSAMKSIRKDMDVLQIEAILATDARHTGVIEKGINLVKSLISNGGVRLDETMDLSSKSHVRKALAQVVKQIEAGGDAEVDARKFLPVIRTAAKETGVEAGLDRSAIIIEKDAKGDWRWIGTPTNNFIDWQEDILSKSAHEKYVAWLDENPECAPVFVTWHTAGTARENPVDFWMQKDGAVVMSGILTEDEAAALLTVQKDVDLGMSHQAFALRLDPEDSRVITDYWMYEVSDLPVDRAANPFTMLETMTKEVGMDKLEYLATIMGSEKAEAFLKKTGQVQKTLQEAGITSKEKEEAPAESPAAVVTPPSPAAPVSVDLAEIVKELEKQFDIPGLNAFVAQAQEDHSKVEVLESLVKELSKSSDDQLEKALTPPVARFAWSQANRPSQSDGTKLQKGKEDEGEDLANLQPGVPEDYWLSKATNTVPIQAP